MNVRDNYHGRFTDMTRSLCQGKKFRIAPVPHVITGRVGALGSSDNTGNTATVQTHSTTVGHDKSDSSSDSHKLASTKISSFRCQDKKKHSSTKDTAKISSSSSRVSQPFTDIFGTPIKTKPSPEQAGKQKEGNTGIQGSQKVTAAHTKPNKVPINLHPASNSSSSTKENKVSRKEKSPRERELKETKHTKSSKHQDKESKQPYFKRQSSPPQVQYASDKKRKRTTSSSSESNSVPQPSTAAEKKEVPKSKHNKELKVKEKHKSKPAVSTDNDNSISNSRKEKSKEKIKVSKLAKKLSAENNGISSPLCQGTQKISDVHVDETSTYTIHSEERVDTSLVENKEDSVIQIEDLNSSPSSSISLSSLAPGGSHGPLATMMAEMEKGLLSPLSSEPDSHSLSNSPVAKEKLEDNCIISEDVSVLDCPSRVIKELLEEETIEKLKDEPGNIGKSKKDDVEQTVKVKKEQTTLIKKKRDEEDGKAREETIAKSSVRKMKVADTKITGDKEKKVCAQSDQAYENELMDLQQKIMSLRDRHILQKIVDVIEETGKYDVTNSSFDFDLCRLDQLTVRKLKSCLTVK